LDLFNFEQQTCQQDPAVTVEEEKETEEGAPSTQNQEDHQVEISKLYDNNEGY
jgi:hypothetical protein